VKSSELLGEEGSLRCAVLPGQLVMADAAAAAEQTPEQDLQGKLKERLQAEFVSAVDLSDGCGSKFQCVIISALFEGKPLLVRRAPRLPSPTQILNLVSALPFAQERHRLVNEALKVEMEVRHARTGLACRKPTPHGCLTVALHCLPAVCRLSTRCR
jgi:stress-induced morphogen